MRPLEHGNGGVVGERFPEGSVAGSVTGDGLPHLLTSSVCDLDRGDVLAGRFQIEAVLGTGGSGRVLRAFDRESRTPVALKILRQELAGEPVWAERFARELRVGRAISHANVCRVFDIGEADGHRFLSMELAAGGSLRADVPKVDAWQAARRQGPPRDWADRVSDARAIVAGVAALHQAGIVHRDLKPENILRMADGRLVVTDFGLATDPGSGPGTTIMVGTPSYMAPEVVMGDPATMRSDVWGLGMVLHEVFFGLRPQWKVLGRGYRRFVRPDAARTPVERAVADLCGRCADDDPQLRPPTADEVVRELERALRGKQVIARHVRQRLLWGATAVVAVAALVVVKMHYTNRAEASSTLVASSIGGQVLQTAGSPQDWSVGTTRLASFPGRLHCFSLVDGGKKVRAIWGTPRRAEDIDLRTSRHEQPDLLPETYQDGCPSLSRDGKSLLFEKASDTGSHIFLSSSANGANARQLARGRSPEWLPNSQEFAFALDSLHAAVFAIPTGDMTVIGDEDLGARQLGELSIDPKGMRIAVRYTTDKADNPVVVHNLPGLEVVSRFRLPLTAEHLEFRADGDSVDFLVRGSGAITQMGTVSLAHPDHISMIGALFDEDLQGSLSLGAGARLLAGYRMKRNVWVEGDHEQERALTSDDHSVRGSLSPDGTLLLQRLSSGDRSVIVRRSATGQEVQVSDGPLDATPMFVPGSTRWLYAKFAGGQIMECNDTEQPVCNVLHSDPLLPGFPSPSPLGTRVAYLTLMNVTRLRVVNRSSGQVDLGPVGGDTCAPYWTSEDRIWVAESQRNGVAWSEFVVDKHTRTGAVVPVAPGRGRDCQIPRDLQARRTAGQMPAVFVVSEESSELISNAPELSLR